MSSKRNGTPTIHRFVRMAVFLAGSIYLVSCSSSRRSIGRQADSIPPGTCRVSVTVISIDTTRSASSSNDPCSKAPCNATVRIDNVIGYGSAFPKPLARGATIVVTFAYTVAPTKDLLPRLGKAYPGVRIGTTLEADIHSEMRLSLGGRENFSLIIYGYSIH